MQTDWGQPRPRHQYTYHPRPWPGQKGVLTYSGPLNMTAAAQGYNGYGAYGGYGAMGYGAGAYGAYGTAPYGGVCGGAYSVRQTAYYPNRSYYSYKSHTSRPYHPYPPTTGYNSYYAHGQSYGGHASHGHGPGNGHGHGCQCHSHYGCSTVAPSYAYVVPASSSALVATTSTSTTQAATPSSTVQYAYVAAAATPTALPTAYTTTCTTTKCATHARAHAHSHTLTHRVVTTPTPEDIQLENRRVATERGAYRPRKIKPADAKPDDMFWCRERNGDWHCRPYYQIEDHCYPGLWQMDAEHGFLVFHRE